MGLFDKFRKKVRDAASVVDESTISAEEGTEEAAKALSQQKEFEESQQREEETVTTENLLAITSY